MNKKLQNKPLTIQQQDIARLAQQGLQRALEARQLTELTTQELKSVAGGAEDIDILPISTGKIVPPPPILMGRFTIPPKK